MSAQKQLDLINSMYAVKTDGESHSMTYEETVDLLHGRGCDTSHHLANLWGLENDWIDQNGEVIAVSFYDIAPDMYRVRIVEDDEPYEHGDLGDEDEVNALIEKEGLWGFIVEKRTGLYSWQHVDSCFGFAGYAGVRQARSEARQSIPTGARVEFINDL